MVASLTEELDQKQIEKEELENRLRYQEQRIKELEEKEIASPSQVPTPLVEDPLIGICTHRDNL